MICLTMPLPELKDAFLEFKVLFFCNQPMDKDQHVAFARQWGLPQGPGAVPQVDDYPQIKDQQFDELTTIGSDVNYHADDTFSRLPLQALNPASFSDAARCWQYHLV